MRRRRNHPLIQLVIWLAISLVCCLLALVAALSVASEHGDQLDNAHRAGMVLGQQLCQGFRAEADRVPSPAARRQKGLL
ncbi:hypothetical protein [Acidovorax sp. BLS4]|uniref:hypothetical protein n=1 Tax=Acidovorax sp. BLS4 TaxID=3273430 RepID=UPI002942F3BD|nr:hypothetical protein [Paracidovorax avenae]WOI47715.1 hypothetical protein R1Z03_11080 [Paracidovorax avenae]